MLKVLNHRIPTTLMDEVQSLTREHYHKCMEKRFKESEASRAIEGSEKEVKDIDWESTFFLTHLPSSNMNDIPDLTPEYR